MIATSLIALLAAAQTSTASLGVGATVVRPAAQPVVAVARGTVTVSNAGNVIVTAEGATLRRANDGTILVTPGRAGAMTIILTY
ncbi:MAG TPA: hypothetical protein VES64_09330 [Allosphingosinicella sp.]|nr:hypothetical protein [Allosphingosinicella sp.]